MRVLTNEGLVLSEEAVSIRAPGARGFVGFLYHHAPLVTTLRPGLLSWRRAGGERQTLRIGSGLLEIVHNRMTVLTDTVAAAAPAAAH